jgi:hypothetical protein
MARPQVQGGPRFPRLVPAAGVQASAAISAPVVGSSFAPISQELGGIEAALIQRGRIEGARQFEKERGQVAANPELVQELLDAAPDDPDARARILGRAVSRGLISRAENPYFSIALRTAEGRAAGQRALLAVQQRLGQGEHLPRVDPATGAFLPGTDALAIYGEEVARYRGGVFLQSTLGSAAFANELERLGPGLMAEAQASIDAAELRQLQRNVGDELTNLALRTRGAPAEEVLVIGAAVQQRADDLWRAGVENWREVTAQGLLRGVDLLAQDDPDRALLSLNTVISDFKVGQQTLDEYPGTAILLATKREKLRQEADYQQREQLRDQAVARQEQQRAQEEYLLGSARALREEGLPASEARRQLRSELEARVEYEAQSDDVRPNAEHLRRDGLLFIDAILDNEHRSDPAVLEETRQAITLARTEAELVDLEDSVRALAGAGLQGPELESTMSLVRARIQEVREGFTNSSIYRQASDRLNRIGAPAGLPTGEGLALEEELRTDRAAFNAALRESGAWSNGQLDVEATEKLAARFEARMVEKAQAGAVRLETAKKEALTALLDNASAAQMRREFQGRFDEDELRQWTLSAEKRQQDIDGTLLSPRVQATTQDVRAAMEEQLKLAGVGPAGRASALLELDVELRERALERLRGKPVDPTNVERTLIQTGTELARERLKDLGGSDIEAQGQFLGLSEGLEGDAVRQAEIREADFRIDVTRGLAIADGAPNTLTTQGNERLAARAAVSDPSLFASIQAAPYASGLLARRLPLSNARARLRQRLATDLGEDRSKAGGQYVAVMGPVGIPIEEVVAGKAKILANRFVDGQPVGLEEVEVSLPVKDIPPFSTPFFDSEASFRRFWNTRGDDLDRLLLAWGITTPAAQQVWRDTQLALARRQEAAAARNGR